MQFVKLSNQFLTGTKLPMKEQLPPMSRSPRKYHSQGIDNIYWKYHFTFLIFLAGQKKHLHKTGN